MCTQHICVVVPVYLCCHSLTPLFERLKTTLSSISDKYEIIFVNDASPDHSWDTITSLAIHNKHVKGIKLSRNFGQHHAIAAGIDYSNSDWLVVMDCDLQDKPEEILKLYATAQKGFDIVFGKRTQRKDSFFKQTESKIFYKFYNYFTDSDTNCNVNNFSIVSRNVINEVKKFTELNRPYALIVNWLGFPRKDIDVEHNSRDIGQSSYSFRTSLDLAIDIILSHSNKPLRLSIKFGFILSSFSMTYAIYLIIQYFISNIDVPGWTSAIVSTFFLSGLLFANLGIIGLYIGKIYDELKHRPFYIVQETTFTNKMGQE